MVVADKPVDSWSDKDSLTFEIKLGEVVKRFKSVESIIELSLDHNTGFEARKVTITHQDGREFSEVLWIDSTEKDTINSMTQEIKKEYFKNNDKINKALLSSIIEEVLSPVKELKEEGKNKKYGS